MILEDKNAIVYGAGGAIGGAVARAFAREGANVFLAGRTREDLDEVAGAITPPVGWRRWRKSMPSTSGPSKSTPTP